MLITLLVLSFILHIFTFYVLIILMQRINQIKNTSPDTVQQEIEESLSAYLITMQEENEKFLKEFEAKFKGTSPSEENKTPPNRVPKVPSVSLVEHVKDDEDEQNLIKQTAAEIIENLMEENPKEMVELSLQAQAIHLSNQGMSSLDIAKKLNRGKGEIDLLLKFHDKR